MRKNLLDHGYVDLIETWGSDERIVEAARMSTGKGFLGWGPTCRHAPPIRVALVLDGWQWAVRLGLGRVGGELIKVDWAKADELLRDAKTAWMCSGQTEMAQNAAGGVA